jgi:hypothetical protein
MSQHLYDAILTDARSWWMRLASSNEPRPGWLDDTSGKPQDVCEAAVDWTDGQLMGVWASEATPEWFDRYTRLRTYLRLKEEFGD